MSTAKPDPTSPAGMSYIARLGELERDMDINGLDPVTISSLTREQSIQAVVQSRLKKEQYMKAEAERVRPGKKDGTSDLDLPEPPDTSLFIGLPGVKDYIFDGHAGTGPSGAARWMTCTASLGASRSFLETLTPNQQVEFAQSSTAARQGTTAHAAAEVEALVVLGRMDPAEAEATLLELAVMPEAGEEYDDEMAEYIAEHVDLIKSYADTRGSEKVLIEQRVETTVELMTVDANGDPHLYTIPGSADVIVLPTEAEPSLVVDDLKYGEGEDVDVEHNPQVRIYALGALAMLVDDEGYLKVDFDKIVYHIVQPRLGGIKTWEESVEDLLTWRDEVLSPALTEALGGAKAGAKFSPSSGACQWCPNRGRCPALIESRIDAASELFDAVTDAEFNEGPGVFPETDSLPDDVLGKYLKQVTDLVKLKDALKEEMQRRLYRGRQVPGWQLVNYTPPRKWKAGAAEELDRHDLPDALFQRSLITPTAAEKLLGERYSEIADLVEKPDKRPVVAPEGDRRKTWEGKPPEAMFDDESDRGV